MINYWWVTRPKRKLNSVPEVLAGIAEVSLDIEWQGQRNTHLNVEEALEKAGLKRVGERRDQTGGGARTYIAWLRSLGLIFTQQTTKKTKLTLAGEALLNGEPPVEIITNQILKYQFPSAFSIGRGVCVSERFKVHPFVFLLRLLVDSRVRYLTQEEIAKVVITEAETDKDECFEYIVKRISDFRNYGDAILEENFFEKYASGKKTVNSQGDFSHLEDTANTFINWIEYTQLAIRKDKKLVIVESKKEQVEEILKQPHSFIDRWNEEEYFQRKFGVDPRHNKDTRNLTNTKTVTPQMIAEQKIVRSYIQLASETPVSQVSEDVINYVANVSGFESSVVAETLNKRYPYGSIGSFMTKYYEMAFKGRDEATEFEKATAELFDSVFGFKTKHVGPIGLTPDVLLISEKYRYAGIIDNKAYSEYTINNDHHNRMVQNYLGNVERYYPDGYPIAFFSYIAGGFGKNIDTQIKKVVNASGTHGSAIDVHNVIELVKKNTENRYSQAELKDLFSVDRRIKMSDL